MGKWFAAAKDAKLFEKAIALASLTPCSPQALTRASRDFAKTNPTFALEAGVTAIRWLVQAHGYDVTALRASWDCAHFRAHAARIAPAPPTSSICSASPYAELPIAKKP